MQISLIPIGPQKSAIKLFRAAACNILLSVALAVFKSHRERRDFPIVVGMRKTRLIARVPSMLLITPALCAITNLSLLLLPFASHRMQTDNFDQKIVSVVSIILCWVCLITAMWRSNWRPVVSNEEVYQSSPISPLELLG